MPSNKPKVDPDAMVRYRVLAGHSQTLAATSAGISAGHLSRIESGVGQPSPVALARLATVYGVTSADLLADADSEAVA